MKNDGGTSPTKRGVEIGLYVLASVLGGLVLTLALRLWQMDPAVPVHYTQGGDSDFFLALFCNTIESGWYTTSGRLGAPGTMDLHDFPDLMTGTFVLVRAICLFTRELGYVFNGYYGLTFLLAIWTSLFAMRRLGVDGLTSVAFSLLFAFSPYHLYRGMNHPHYSAYYPIPLVVLICLWIIEGEPLLLIQDPETKQTRLHWNSATGIPTILGVLLISMAGPYYLAFSLVLIVSAAGIAVLRCPSRLLPGFEAVLFLTLCAAIYTAQMVPYISFRLKNGDNPSAVKRDATDYYSYALSLNNLLMPSAWHRLTLVRPLSLGHEPVPIPLENTAFHGQNEAVGSNPLGLVGTLGLLTLLAIGIAAPVAGSQQIAHLANLAALTIIALLFALSGGVSEMIALHLTPLLRSYNRMAVFLSFMSFLAGGLLVSACRNDWASTARLRRVFMAVVTILTGFALWEQIPAAVVPDYARERSSFQSDRQFMQGIEALVPAKSQVFQLPVVDFPEARESTIPPYDHFRGFTHSQTLRWSFGATKGRRQAEWQARVAARPIPEMITALRQSGFMGLYINRNGYEDGGARMLEELKPILGLPQLESRRHDLWFFKLSKIRDPGNSEIIAP